MSPPPPSRMPFPVFVLDASPAGLAAVRSLGRAGAAVTVLDWQRGPAFDSRYGSPRRCPHPIREESALRQFLIDAVAGLDRPVVLYPASDGFFAFVSRNRLALAPNFRFNLPDPEASVWMLDKRRQYEAAVAVGVPIPKTFFPGTIEDVRQIVGQIDYPAFIKPHHGHEWREHFPSKGFVVTTAADAEARYRAILPTGVRAMIQSYVLGPPSNSYSVAAYLDEAGQCQETFTARKIRQNPMDAGVGTFVESCDAADAMDVALAVFHGLRCRGIAEVEVKRDDRDGRLKLIEVNPRLWLQAALASHCGVDFPLIQYRDLTGGARAAPTRSPALGVRWLDLLADFETCREAGSTGRTSLARCVLSWFSARSFATFDWRDPKPFLTPTASDVLGRAGRKFRKLLCPGGLPAGPGR